MTITAAKLQVIVTGDTRDAEVKLSGLSKLTDGLGHMISTALGTFAGNLMNQALTGIQNLAKEALGAYANYERLGASLTSLVSKELLNAGSADDMASAMAKAAPIAQELQRWIEQLALQSPFTSQGVADAFRTSLAYGFTTKEAQRLTQAMIDFSAGSGATEASMSQIALALGQIQAKGKLSGQEVLQLVNAGLSVDKILADAFGKTTAEIVAMREKGLIPADQAIEAIVSSLENDFGGAAKAQAGTFSGLLASLEDVRSVGLREFFEGTFKAIQPLLTEFVNTISSEDFMSGLNQLGQNVGNFIAPIAEGVSTFFKVRSYGGDIFTALRMSFFKLFDPETATKLSGFTRNIEKVFNQIAPVIESLPEKIRGFFTSIIENPTVQTVIGNIRDAFQNIGTFWKENGPGLTETVQNFLGRVAEIGKDLIANVLPFLSEKFELISAWFVENGPLIRDFADTMATAFGNIIETVAALWAVVQPILSGLIDIILDVGKYIMQVFTGDFDAAFATGKEIVATAWETIKAAFSEFANWVTETFLGVTWAEVTKTWEENWEMFKEVVRLAWEKITEWVEEKKLQMVTAIADLGKSIGDFVADKIDPLVTAFENVRDAVKDLVSWILNLIQKFTTVKIPGWAVRHSPSPIEQTFGNWLDYTKELTKEMPKLGFSMNVPNMTPAPQTVGASGGITIQGGITVNALPGQDARQLANQIMYELERVQRNRANAGAQYAGR